MLIVTETPDCIFHFEDKKSKLTMKLHFGPKKKYQIQAKDSNQNIVIEFTCSKLFCKRLLRVIKDSNWIPLYNTSANVGNNSTTMDMNLKSHTPNFEVIFLPIKVITALWLPKLGRLSLSGSRSLCLIFLRLELFNQGQKIWQFVGQKNDVQNSY